jgi:hypothetical protein
MVKHRSDGYVEISQFHGSDKSVSRDAEGIRN